MRGLKEGAPRPTPATHSLGRSNSPFIATLAVLHAHPSVRIRTHPTGQPALASVHGHTRTSTTSNRQSPSSNRQSPSSACVISPWPPSILRSPILRSTHGPINPAITSRQSSSAHRQSSSAHRQPAVVSHEWSVSVVSHEWSVSVCPGPSVLGHPSVVICRWSSVLCPPPSILVPPPPILVPPMVVQRILTTIDGQGTVAFPLLVQQS